MEFQQYLEQLLNDLPACDAAFLMGMDGLAVAKATRDPGAGEDLEAFAAQYTHLLQSLHQALHQFDADSQPYEHIHVMDRFFILARFITSSYYVLLRVRPEGLLGHARYRLHRLCQQLAQEIGSI